MAHGGNIHQENHGFTGIIGPALASAFNHSPDLRSGDLDLVVYSGHALGTGLHGSILEFTYMGGQYPLSSPAVARSST
jgi:hypothetical protein